MKIKDIQVGTIDVPLKKAFTTALRTAGRIEDVVVRINTDTGHAGYGEAAPTAVITGDTKGSIAWAIENVIAGQLLGLEIENIEEIMRRLNQCLMNNTSAKAAVDMAIYDLFGQRHQTPLFQLWGGFRRKLVTNITISVDEPETMALDSLEAVKLGYDILKIKVGKNPRQDMERLKAIRKMVGNDITLRIDANQGWKPKEAVAVIRKLEDEGLNIELVEQPVAAYDLEGLKYVTDNVSIPVMADESVFSPRQALKIMQMRAADLLNIKLMKTGGFYNALKICALAETYGVECMMGCMLESKISATAAAHLAAAKHIITRVDLDGPALCREDPVEGGAVFDGPQIMVGDGPGLGFTQIRGVVF